VNGSRPSTGPSPSPELDASLHTLAAELGVQLTTRQSNSEGTIIDWIQAARRVHDDPHGPHAAGRPHHQSWRLHAHERGHPRCAAGREHPGDRGAPQQHSIGRETFRQVSVTGVACAGVIMGLGTASYLLALRHLAYVLAPVLAQDFRPRPPANCRLIDHRSHGVSMSSEPRDHNALPDLRYIRELAKVFRQYDLDEIEIENGEQRVLLRRSDIQWAGGSGHRPAAPRPPRLTSPPPARARPRPRPGPGADPGTDPASPARHLHHLALRRHLLPLVEPGDPVLRRGRQHRAARAAAVHRRGDEAVQRARGRVPVRDRGGAPRERPAGRIRVQAVRVRKL
jgi:hypothetical protein